MPSELDQMNQGMDQDPTMGLDSPEQAIGLHGGEADREGEMAKIDLQKIASYAQKLDEKMQDEDQLEAWVQKKIAVSAENLASVYHYLAYEMQINEYAEMLKNTGMLSEGQQSAPLIRKIMEAKKKVAELKKAQAEKVKAGKQEKMDESMMEPCSACGGHGHVEKRIPEEVKAKAEKYNRLTKAMKAAHKRLDANHNGIPDDEELEEANFDGERGGDQDTPSKFNKQKTSTGARYTRKSSTFSDEHDGGSGIKSHAKSKSAAEKKSQAPEQKQSPKSAKTWGMKGGEKFDNRDKEKTVNEAKMTAGQKAHHHAHMYADCHKKGQLEMAMHHLEECEACGGKIHHGAMGECYHTHPEMNGGQMYECGTMTTMPTTMHEAKKCCCETKGKEKCPVHSPKKMEEAKPSAGLSAAKKSAVVKKAKAGGDIGKPGKSFDKVAKGAGGGEKGEKIAAAAMWKNMKETVAYIAEKAKATKDLPGKQEKLDVNHNGKIDGDDLAKLRAGKKQATKESSEVSRLKEVTGRLNVFDKPGHINESSDVNQIRALTQRLLG